MILLPAPQSVRIDDGGHQLRPGRRIHVTGGLMAGGDRAAPVRIGAAVQDALAAAGAATSTTSAGCTG